MIQYLENSAILLLPPSPLFASLSLFPDVLKEGDQVDSSITCVSGVKALQVFGVYLDARGVPAFPCAALPLITNILS